MSRIASPVPAAQPDSLRSAVLDLLARAAPKPAALAVPSAEEQEFLETLRRIVARNAAEDLWVKYHTPHRNGRAWRAGD